MSAACNGLRMPFVVGGTLLRLSVAAQNKTLAEAIHLGSCEDEFEKVEQERDFWTRGGKLPLVYATMIVILIT